MEVFREQMLFLLEQNLYDSAEILGCFLMSAIGSSADLSPTARAENLILFADALYGKKEYRRALNIYRQALQQCRVSPKQNLNSGGRSTLQAGSRSSSASPTHAQLMNEHEVKYKIALCHLAVNDSRSALSEMEGIPSKARTLHINLTLARLYRVTGYERAAIAFYKECLRQCPYAMEAIIALAELGVTHKEIQPQGQSKNTRLTNGHLDQVRWLQRYAEAQCAVACHDYKGGLEHLYQLGQRFPSNLHLILETAKVEVALGKTDDAIHNFEKARQVDQFNITSMDEYAMLLRSKSEHPELNRLVQDLLSIDPARPEAWVASAIYWDMREDKERAATYADKSIRVDERHGPAYIVKGNIALSMNRPEAALAAFRKAQALKPDLRSYQGLVQALLKIPKHKEALFAARDAMKAMSHSAKALTLVGDVYAHITDGREKARKFYESALRLEPGYLEAVLALAELHVLEGRNGEAIALLQKYLKNWTDDGLHTKLAQILAATSKVGESLSHYQIALSINPHNEVAKKGLDRLEKQMKGVDPDALEEEENEGEDVDGDQQDEEFM